MIFAKVLTAAAAAAALFASAPSFGDDAPSVKIGVVGENNEQWKPIIARLKEEGVTAELVKFNDYALPNRALEDGDIDLHACMTGEFLRTESQAHGYHLTAIGTTIITPLAVFSKKIKSLSEIPDGASFAVPGDPITTGRALRLLEANGVLKLKENAGWTPTVKDITENPHQVQFHFVDPGNAFAALEDVTASFINGEFAVDHGLSLSRDAIAVENTHGWGLDNPFVNVIASRTADKDKPLYQHIVDLYHTDEVVKVLHDTYGEAYIPAFTVGR